MKKFIRGPLLIMFVLSLIALPLSAVEPMDHPETGEPGYWLTEPEFDKTIIKAEQANALKESLEETLIQLDRERKWKRFTLSVTLPLAGAFVGDQINKDYGLYVGLAAGGLISWLISTFSN